jgi:hypothetical protein
MLWDDELERFANQVFEIFGDQALGEAVRRALASVPAIPSDELPEEIIEAAAAAPGMPTKFVDGIDSARALKAELRRLLGPH